MILNGALNGSKGNAPMKKILDTLKQASMEGHYLTSELATIFADNHADSGGYPVPTEDFFSKRSSRMIDLMVAFVQADFETKKMTFSSPFPK